MRTIAKYELKVGENTVTLPIDYHVIVASSDGERMWLLVEVETDTREFTNQPFLVSRVGEELNERMVLNLVGSGKVGEEMVVVWEIL